MENPKAVELWLDVVDDPGERVRQLAKLSSTDRQRLGDLLDPETGTELFESVDVSLAAKVVKSQPVSRGAELVSTVEPNRAADILRRFDSDARDALLSAMPIERAKLLRSSLFWSTDSVAAHMMTEPLTLVPETTAAQAVEQIRARMSERRKDTRVGAQVYVTDPDQHLIGVVPYRELVLAEAATQVSELSEGEVVTTVPLTNAGQAAHLLVDRRLSELPVVDSEGRLLGVLTEADARDIIEGQATEDAEKQGGSTPLEVPYLSASPLLLWRKRIIWLLVLFAAEAYTGTVLRAFEDEMEAVVALAFFIPLLIGTGGNTGTQITTTLVRAMGTGQVRLRDLPAVVAKEMTTGSMIAVMMALAAMIRAWTLGVGPQITLTVCLTVAAIVMWSAFVASILPLVLKKVRVDPAVVSAPLVATVVDGTGLMIYFRNLLTQRFLSWLGCSGRSSAVELAGGGCDVGKRRAAAISVDVLDNSCRTRSAHHQRPTKPPTSSLRCISRINEDRNASNWFFFFFFFFCCFFVFRGGGGGGGCFVQVGIAGRRLVSNLQGRFCSFDVVITRHPAGHVFLFGHETSLELTGTVDRTQGIVGAAVVQKQPVSGRPKKGVLDGHGSKGQRPARRIRFLTGSLPFPIVVGAKRRTVAVVSIDEDLQRIRCRGWPVAVPDNVLPGLRESAQLAAHVDMLQARLRPILGAGAGRTWKEERRQDTNWNSEFARLHKLLSVGEANDPRRADASSSSF